jgi:hypothetical protein
MKEKIQKMYVKAINEDLPPNVFADQILRLFGVSDTLPFGYVSPKNELPENGESVMVITDIGRNAEARFESFLGNEIWETDYVAEEDEMVVGWKKK